MIQPQTLKTTVEYAKGAWAPVGPLVGVLVGAWLARSWDRQKWMKDNRKQECRELLTAITHAATLLMEKGMIKGNGRGDAYLESLKVFQSRIFIAKEIEKHKLFGQWVQSVSIFLDEEGDRNRFGVNLDQIRNVIIDIATK